MRSICLVGPTEKDNYFISAIQRNGDFSISLVVSSNIFSKAYKTVDYCFCYENNIDELFDEVIICESRQCTDSYLLGMIQKFLTKGKVVKNYHVFSDDYRETIEEYKSKYSSLLFDKVDYKLSRKSLSLYSSSMPAIYVVSLTDDMQKMEVELGIKEELVKRGYTVSWLCSNPMGEYIDGVPYLNRINCNEIDKFAKEFSTLCCEEEKQNEVLLIGVPACLFSAEESSIGLHIMRKICDPDYIVLNVYDNALITNELSELMQIPISALGKEADQLVLSATITDVVKYEIYKPSDSLYIGDARNKYYVEESPYALRSNDEKIYSKIVDNLLNKLS